MTPPAPCWPISRHQSRYDQRTRRFGTEGCCASYGERARADWVALGLQLTLLPGLRGSARSKALRLFLLLFLEILQLGIIFPILPGITMDFFAQKHNNGTAPIECENYHHDNLPEACKKGNSVRVHTPGEGEEHDSRWGCAPGRRRRSPAEPPGTNPAPRPQDAAFINGLSSAVSGFLTFLMSPLLGSLSDSFGRKPFLVVAQATSLLPSIALVLFDKGTWSLYPYFFLNGLSGAVSSVSLVLAYIADVSSPENRTGAFGLVLAVFSIGLLGTPVMGALLPRDSVFMVAAGAGVVCVVFLVLFVPESLPKRLRKPFAPHELNPLRDVSILMETRLFRRLSVVVMLDNMVMQGVIAILTYYLQQELDFHRTQISTLLLAFGVSGFISNGVLLKWMTSVTTEKRIIVIGAPAVAACVRGASPPPPRPSLEHGGEVDVSCDGAASVGVQGPPSRHVFSLCTPTPSSSRPGWPTSTSPSSAASLPSLSLPCRP